MRIDAIIRELRVVPDHTGSTRSTEIYLTLVTQDVAAIDFDSREVVEVSIRGAPLG
jgi:hypothetical protein